MPDCIEDIGKAVSIRKLFLTLNSSGNRASGMYVTLAFVSTDWRCKIVSSENPKPACYTNAWYRISTGCRALRPVPS
jgi:hypothetical protein